MSICSGSGMLGIVRHLFKFVPFVLAVDVGCKELSHTVQLGLLLW